MEISILSFIVLLLYLSHPTHSTPQPHLKLHLTLIKHSTSPSHTILLDSNRLVFLHHRLTSPLISGASTGSGQYFASISLGSPPQPILLVADTGSDLTWLKCSPCQHHCSLHHPPHSTFFPLHSSSFKPTHCYHPSCKLITHPSKPRCNRTTAFHSSCFYEYSYSDGSLTSGIFSQETTSLNSTSGKLVRFPGIRFGCGFNVSGPSLTGSSFEGANGVLGLGRGPISFPAQLGPQFGNKFSYCLLDYTLSPPPTSFLIFGGVRRKKNHRSNHHQWSTPLITTSLSPTFYYIGIKSVSINGVKLPINPSVWALDDLGNGGTIIDSGTTLTFLPQQAYRKILSAMRKQIKLPRVTKSITQSFDLCYNVSGVRQLSLPLLSLLLVGDSVFDPPTGNYFIDVADDVKCLALQPVISASGFGVVGNLMQQGFLFEFDIERSRLYYSRHGCGV